MTTQTQAASSSTKEYKQYRNFNNFVAEARIVHTEIRASKDGEFVCVTAVTNLADDEEGVALRFTSNNGALTLAKKGALMAGRRVHVTGSISGFSSHYVNSDGQVVPLARARMQLQAVTLRLGAKPAAKTA